jgi:hypothetical protein
VFDLIGQMFDRLTVIARAGSDKQRNPVWLCRCVCGAETLANTAELRHGRKRSCGCLRRDIAAARHAARRAAVAADPTTLLRARVGRHATADLTGRTFGDWTVAAMAPRLVGRTAWLCRCVCGRERAVNASNLVRGRSVSCGLCRPASTSAATPAAVTVRHAPHRPGDHHPWRGRRRTPANEGSERDGPLETSVPTAGR